MHDISLITTIALGLAAALFFGLLARRFGLSPIVGYLVAGVVIGPNTPGFVGDLQIASQLAEIGVVLLMFGVGLHFHLRDLLAVRSIAVPGALGQSVAATLACMGLAMALGWDMRSGLVLGVAVSVASTVVLLRALSEHGSVQSPEGHVAIGWLVVEDILTVLVLVLLPALVSKDSGVGGVWLALGMALLKLGVLVALIFLAGARLVPWLFLRVARFRSPELFTLTVLVLAISVATASNVVFGASMALGAFLAGMVVGQSKVSHQAAADALPLRDAFAVLFFVAVGMLFDFRVVVEAPWLTLGVIGVILVVKPLVAMLIVLAGGQSLKTGVTVAGGLAQIGEFSFILADQAGSLGVMPSAGRNAIIAGAIVSISLNPWLFRLAIASEPALSRLPGVARWIRFRCERRGTRANARTAQATDGDGGVRAVVVGYGPAGQTVCRLLRENGVVPMVVETNIDTVQEIQGGGGRAIYGDATKVEILKAAGLASAAYLVVTVPKAEIGLAVVMRGREVNPSIRVLARASYLKDREAFMAAGAGTVCVDEGEAAVALAAAVMEDLDVSLDRRATSMASVRSSVKVPAAVGTGDVGKPESVEPPAPLP